MPIPEIIKISARGGSASGGKGNILPPSPGVYFMKDASGKILYIGKATSLKTRVGSYFSRPQEPRITKMVSLISEIDYVETPTTIEALLLEAQNIKKHQPQYNVMEKDDKSFVHLAFTRETFPHPVLIRGYELAKLPKKNFLKVFGPFKSAGSVRAALDTLRKSFPWTMCNGEKKRSCFYRHLGLCPGVCTGEITKAEYKKIIDGLIQFFSGKRTKVVRQLKSAMQDAAKAQNFESAAVLRNRLFALDHIRDIAVLKHEDVRLESFINIFGRIEGYDISNISGENAVGSMVVFEDGEPKKRDYKIFHITTVEGPNDTAMMREVFKRRFAHNGEEKNDTWRLPDIILVDGGAGQLGVAKQVLEGYNLHIPLIGIAKGFDRKQDELVYEKNNEELSRLVFAFKPLLQRVRDEAHRFAVRQHRMLRGKMFLKKS